jgi:hypothetical protein
METNAFDEKRSATRWLTCLKGRVRTTDGRVVDCLIRDFSASGARIQISDAGPLPSVIDLFFPLNQATYRANVRWERDNEFGLSFQAPEVQVPMDPVQAQLHERLMRLEADNADLRLEAAQLRLQLEHVAASAVGYFSSTPELAISAPSAPSRA